MWSDGPMIRCEGVFRPGTIMNRAFHFGAVLTVAVHMVFGCCLHHAHASGRQVDLPDSVDAACPCEHHGHQHERQPCDHSNGPEGCDEGQCTFIRPDSPGNSDLLAGFQCLPLISCLPPLPMLSETDTAELAPSRLGAPIPLHLLNQVLLI